MVGINLSQKCITVNSRKVDIKFANIFYKIQQTKHQELNDSEGRIGWGDSM